MSTPAGWRSVTLGDIAVVYSGGTPSRSVPAYWGGGISWATTAEVDSPLITSTKETITELGLAHSSAKIVPAGALLMAMYGQGKTRGKTSMLGIDSAVNQACAAIQPSAAVEPQFLLAYLRHNYDLIRGLSNAGGQENLSGGLVRQIPILLPSTAEQARIADVSRDADRLIGRLERLIAKRQAIRQGVLQQLLAEATQNATVALADVATRIGSGITPRGGSTVYKSSGRPFVRSQNVGWGSLRLDDLAYIDEATHKSFLASEIRAEDVLLNITGASIGRSAVATAELDGGNVNQHVCEIRIDKRSMDPHCVSAVLNSRIGQDQIHAFQAGGNRQGLNFKQVGSIRLPALAMTEQRTISLALRDSDAFIAALGLLLSKARMVKTGMMQELLTGRTRLPVAEEAS